MVMPAFTRTFDAIVRAEISRDLLLIVLAIEKYRLESGGLPESPAQLVPRFISEIQLDPYSSGPYLYLREDKGFVVYSVGPDRVDGHGAKITGPKGDIVLRVAR